MRRWAPVGTALAAVLMAACGPTATAVHQSSALPATATSGTQIVKFGTLAFDVPMAWPVYDLTSDPGRCVRLDVSAVYLGHQGPNATCPAHAVGRTETLHLEALDQAAAANLPVGAAPTSIHGRRVQVQPGGDINREIVASFPDDRVLATMTYGTDKSVVDSILASARTNP